MENTVIVHFHSAYRQYFDLSLWQWQEGGVGETAFFSRYDSFGAVAQLTYPADSFLDQVYVLVKGQNWSYQTVDYKLYRNSGIPRTEVWLVDGDETPYYSRQAAITSHSYKHCQPHAFDMALNSSVFDKKWGFSGWLGSRYTEAFTAFRLWAPTAEKVELILYDSTDDKASVSRVSLMVRGNDCHPDNHAKNTQGVWFETVQGDLNYQAYAYRIYYRKRHFCDSRDPYSQAVTSDGMRSVVVSGRDLIPDGFSVKQGAEATWRLTNPTQAVLYELHVRDFSKSETSGVSPQNRGKFLGLIESGTVNPYGDKTCFDYVKSLGITHIQLQPVFDHHHVIDEEGNYAYNWGYDPENYMVPDRSFSSNPAEPATRILELKQVIQAYHDAGINVILDVVYNHTYSSQNSAFQLTVPDYYYRMNPDGSFQDGSGCGNETASDKEMFRKYMIDSLLYWVNVYNVDGFRFDLMGLHDSETMRQIRTELDKIDPRLLMYGEGWDMGTGLSPADKAKKDNANDLPGIGFFNDNQRNAIKGAEVYGWFERGFVSGEAKEDEVVKSIIGSRDFTPYQTPSQVINYVEAHDNYNLNDLLWVLNPDDDALTHTKRVEMATAMNLLMQGVAFMQIGQEFLRTKCYPTGHDGELTASDRKRAMNAYNAPDEVNQVDWCLVTKHQDSVAFIREIIQLKTQTPFFSYPSFETIWDHIDFEEVYAGSGLIRFIIRDIKKYEIVFNYSGKRLQNHQSSDIIITNDRGSQENQTTNALTVTVLDTTNNLE